MLNPWIVFNAGGLNQDEEGSIPKANKSSAESLMRNGTIEESAGTYGKA